jgi:hypothetical protein
VTDPELERPDLTCQKCNKPIPYDEHWNTDNGLTLYFSGGYGEFHDDLGNKGQPQSTDLCHECGHDLAEWLGLDVRGWHTHRHGGTQHADHHRGAGHIYRYTETDREMRCECGWTAGILLPTNADHDRGLTEAEEFRSAKAWAAWEAHYAEACRRDT